MQYLTVKLLLDEVCDEPLFRIAQNQITIHLKIFPQITLKVISHTKASYFTNASR